MHGEIGYSPENPYFYDYLTPRELLTYFADVFNLPSNVGKTRTEELLTKVGLSEKDWDRQLRKFSKGMLQRVGLAQSLVNDPKVVFLDEPMSGLDPIGRREIRELIGDLRDEGKTVFMSTHILSDVEALCDEVAILRKGKLAATGRLDDLLLSHAGNQVFEVNLRGIDSRQLAGRLNGDRNYEIENTASGARVRLELENEIDSVLAAARAEGGSLISVVPVKQSLEELFVSKTES
jgi:ABC-2 type transport system ATP-binding protein